MLRTSCLTLLNIKNAGYISAEAYHVLTNVLKPSSSIHYLKSLLDNIICPDNVVVEVRALFEDESIYKSICGMERMKECILNEDIYPNTILKSMLESSDYKVRALISMIGERCFLLDYVFTNKSTLSNRLYVDKNNISELFDFIKKYEKIFIQSYLSDSNESTLVADFQIGSSNSLDANKYKKDNNCIDAVSVENLKYKEYVDCLSRLTKEEFEPFKLFLSHKLETLPVRLAKGIKSIGFHEFYVNYLFADVDKLRSSIKGFGLKSLFDYTTIRQELINHVVCHFDNRSVESELEDKKSFERLDNNDNNQIPYRTLKEIIGEASYSIVSKLFYRKIQELSTRARNAINNYPGDFIEDYVHKKKDIREIDNIGSITATEIISFIEKFDVYETYLHIGASPERLKRLEYEEYFQDYWDDFSYQFFLENGHLPMFHILENWITNQTDRNWNIAKSILPIFANTETKSLNDVANAFGVTRERCRQIYAKTIERLLLLDEAELLSSNITIPKLLIEKKEEWQYITLKIDNIDFMDVDIMSSFILKENCSLTPAFCFYILSVLLANEYTLVGREIISRSIKTKQTWHNTYLIKREIAEAFNFYEIPTLLEETESTLTQDMEMDAESLVIDTFFSAWNSFDTNKVNVVSDILSSILIKECGKMPNDRFQFTLEGKKEVHVPDIIYDILSRRGNPMAIDDVFIEVNEVCPKRCTSVYRLKYYITNDPRVCMIGMTNMVSLLEWNHVKIGSIRDIMVQYLSKFEEPKYIKDIVKYVQQYRDTNEHNIRSSLGSGNQFVHFDGGLFGLKDKTYSSKYSICAKLKSFQQRVNDMEIFLRDNLRFPFCNADDKEEDSLYTWWRRKLIEDGLSDEQREEILRIQDQYKDYPSNRIDDKWCRSYRAYKAFIEEQKRQPKRCNSKEKHLCSWFDRCKVDFKEGNMSPSKEKMYIELCNLL